jgi:hypothetical protein
MKIRFITSVAGERFSYDHDEVVDLPPVAAREFLRARQAVRVEEEQAVAPPPEQATAPAAETAIAAAPETAGKRGRRNRTLKNLGGLLP